MVNKPMTFHPHDQTPLGNAEAKVAVPAGPTDSAPGDVDVAREVPADA